MVPALFCKTAACLDPFVYAITNQKFRDELGNVFPIFKPSEKPKKKKKEDISSESRKIESSVAVIKRNDSEEGVEEVRFFQFPIKAIQLLVQINHVFNPRQSLNCLFFYRTLNKYFQLSF